MGLLLPQIHRLFARGTVSGLSEGQLLARFVGERDESAFEAIISRHGRMVLGVCWRLLADPADVEDAFQATFLVLVRKAGSLSDREALANWLYGVALRVATRLRRDRSRRGGREQPNVREDFIAPAVDADHGELRLVLDAEVARLPARFRAPIVLCYFEGLTHDQAAERLRCPVGTIRSRMTKGRALLRNRLSRRGYAPASSLAAFSQLAEIAPAVPLALLKRTIAAAASAAAGRSVAAGVVSTAAATLAQGVSRAMSATRWMMLAGVVAAVGAAGAGVRVAAPQHGNEPAKAAVEGEAAAEQVRAAQKALEGLEHALSRYETALARNKAQIELLRKDNEELTGLIEVVRKDNTELKARLRELEASAKAKAAKDGPARPAIGEKPAAAAAGPAEKGSGGGVSESDTVSTSPGLIVSESGTNGEIVIFARPSGRSRIYRPPQGLVAHVAHIEWNQTMIVAMGPRAAQLAAYDAGRDRWAIQDLRGEAGGIKMIALSQNSSQVRPCNFSGPRLTQVAVFDVGRFKWSVQELDEPWEEGYAGPHVQGPVAVYILGRHLYAYSQKADRWDTLKLAQPITFSNVMPQPWSIDNDVVAVSQNGRLHVFAASTGRWQTVEPKQ
jgi:RNA polymerase sigma factor (sigma-70 family)